MVLKVRRWSENLMWSWTSEWTSAADELLPLVFDFLPHITTTTTTKMASVLPVFLLQTLSGRFGSPGWSLRLLCWATRADRHLHKPAPTLLCSWWISVAETVPPMGREYELQLGESLTMDPFVGTMRRQPGGTLFGNEGTWPEWFWCLKKQKQISENRRTYESTPAKETRVLTTVCASASQWNENLLNKKYFWLQTRMNKDCSWFARGVKRWFLSFF